MELEMKVMWCKGLSAFNFFQKLTVYAAVSISTKKDSLELTQDQKQEQKTPVDDDGDGNPEWNHPIKFDLRPLHRINPGFEDLCLLFELRNHGQLFGYRTIGDVRVPLTELIQSVGIEIPRFVSYEVRSPQGHHNHHHPQLDGNTTNSDTHVIGYHHQQLDGNTMQNMNSETHYFHHKLDESASISDSGRIQYPNLEEHASPPVVLSATTPTHYHPPPPPPPYEDPHWGYLRPPGYDHW
ncbi:protein SRC2 [Spinacia oleracea]|uniref:Protein SRC2 n=1 Tax=Spinacia oleracea TaxID=3562 RepID=A0A9R0IPL4_SPIOL|nr:protein SRC2-like [Spinacia oleracea]